jgi:hypothetical protein
LPKIRFSDLPRDLWQHLLARVEERRIPLSDLRRLQAWVKSEPFATDADWYRTLSLSSCAAAVSAEKSGVMFQFFRDGVPGARQTPALPAADESGAIPKLEPGECEARVTVRQGPAATERGISFVV